MTTPYRVAAGTAAILASIAVAACGSSTVHTNTSAAKKASSSSTATTSSGLKSAIGGFSRNNLNVSGADDHANAGADKGPALLVYSAQGYDLNTVKAFTKATGIPTELVDDSTGPLIARIQAEKADPQWGLLWVDGATAFAALDRQGLLEQHLHVPAMNALGRKVTPTDHSFVPTGVTMGCTVIYNAKVVKNPPKTWQALLAPSLQGKVGMNDPAVSGPTFTCVAGIMQAMGGEAKGKAFLSKLKAHGLHVSQTNGDTVQLLTSGQINVGLIQSSAAIGTAVTTHGLKVSFLPDLSQLPSAIGVDAKAPKAVQAEAQKFIDYVLSPAGQHQMKTGDPTGDSLFWPVAANTTQNKLVPPFSSISSRYLNPYSWGAKQASIDDWFTNNIAQ